jgi:adenylate kinase family enzyme
MSDPALGVGRRVLVTGMAGAGKSTFSRSLAAKTGLPLIHLDVHSWKPGFQITPTRKTGPCGARGT